MERLDSWEFDFFPLAVVLVDATESTIWLLVKDKDGVPVIRNSKLTLWVDPSIHADNLFFIPGGIIVYLVFFDLVTVSKRICKASDRVVIMDDEDSL